jgi:acyl-coenzyme A synthetase/AMP-(fatty) acid ligase
MRFCLDNILSMGGSVPTGLLERVWARMCPNVYVDYGATEVGSVASADLRSINDTPGRTGYVVPPNSIEIVDEAGKTVSFSTEGIVRLRTPFMANGYFGEPDISALFFRDGWFYPGDHGYVTQDGLLVITGRQETRLNVGGDKINPETVEDVVMKFPGINDAAVLTLPNNLGLEDIYALIQADSTADVGSLRAHCQAHLRRDFVPVHFLVVDRIPRSESGKIERGRLAGLAKTKLA